MKARGTINQVTGDHTGNSVNVILLLLLFLQLILYLVLGPNHSMGSNFVILGGIRRKVHDSILV